MAKTLNDGIDLDYIFQTFRRNWLHFLIFPLLTLLCAVAYLLNHRVAYEVKTTVLIKEDKTNKGVTAADLLSKEFGFGTSKRVVADEAKIMTSTTVLEEVVRRLRLDRSVILGNVLSKREVYGSEVPFSIDSMSLRDTMRGLTTKLEIAEGNKFTLTPTEGASVSGTFGEVCRLDGVDVLINWKGTGPNKDKKEFALVFANIESAAKDIRRALSVEVPKKESNILEFSMKTTQPEKVKDILHAMVAVYNEYSLQDKREISRNTLDFIQKRLMSLTAELAGVESTAQAYKIREGVTSDVGTDVPYYQEKMSETDSQLSDLAVKNTVLNELESVIAKAEGNFSLLPTNLDLGSINLQEQIAEYNRMVQDRERLMKVAGAENPNLKNMTEGLKNLRKGIGDSVKQAKKQVVATTVQIGTRNTQFKTALGSTPKKERELTDIKRQQNIKEGLYLFLLQKQEETAIAMVGNKPDAQIVDRPVTGDKPFGSRKSIVFALATILGLFGAFMYSLAQAIFVTTIQSEMDVSKNTSIPLLASVPSFKLGKGEQIVLGEDSAGAERMRLLRSNLLFAIGKNKHLDGDVKVNSSGKVILVTSAICGEGKSFIALNLGASLAQSKATVVVVGADLRGKNGTDILKSNEDGLTEYLAGSAKPNKALRLSGVHENLYFVPSGTLPANPAEMLMDARMAELMAYLKENFDYVILDSSSIGLVSDAMQLQPFADATLLVVRNNYSKTDHFKIFNDLAEDHKLTQPHIVLNDVNLKKEKGYGYEYGYFSKK